ncbi:hypothetical protein TEK04_12530 [Klenkia sp. LSe6-5]|uniref:DNA-directed RNA polymerase specialized sigma subunit, sigma24 family n=1 Tax=Klenkia sesuvii TaxID=3103137 RepID=A0ABU8DUN8_9ACTN
MADERGEQPTGRLPSAHLPTAYLLTGGDAAARDLLVRGELRGGGLPGLVRAHLGRRLVREAVLAGTSGDPWWLSPADVAAARELARALDRLTRAERTAVVLRWFEGLDDAAVAELVPGAATGGLPDRLGVPATELPARLEGLAALAGQRDLTADELAAEVRGARRRRWSRGLLAAGAVAVLGAAAAWLPGALPAGTPPAARATTADGVAGPSAGPARGSLVDDDALVAALRARLDPGPDEGRLVYAGDAAGGRWVLFVQTTTGGLVSSWFTGPAGADTADLVLSGASWVSGPGPAAWSMAVGTPRSTTLLVVTQPGDRVEVTPGFVVAADGSAARSFSGVDTQDGVAAVELPGAVGPPALAYRVVREDAVVAEETPTSYLSDTSWTAPPGTDPGAARSGPGPVDRTAYDAALDQVATPTGADPAALPVTVLGAGRFPAPGGLTASAVTVAVTFPSGAVVTSTAWTATGTGGGRIATCGVESHPAGTDLATLTVVTRCAGYATDSSTFGATTVVVAPAGTEVRLSDDAGADVQTPALEAGWAYVVDGADDITVFEADGVPGVVSRAGAGPFG